jgi:hypothetical protein
MTQTIRRRNGKRKKREGGGGVRKTTTNVTNPKRNQTPNTTLHHFRTDWTKLLYQIKHILSFTWRSLSFMDIHPNFERFR